MQLLQSAVAVPRQEHSGLERRALVFDHARVRRRRKERIPIPLSLQRRRVCQVCYSRPWRVDACEASCDGAGELDAGDLSCMAWHIIGTYRAHLLIDQSVPEWFPTGASLLTVFRIARRVNATILWQTATGLGVTGRPFRNSGSSDAQEEWPGNRPADIKMFGDMWQKRGTGQAPQAEAEMGRDLGACNKSCFQIPKFHKTSTS